MLHRVITGSTLVSLNRMTKLRFGKELTCYKGEGIWTLTELDDYVWTSATL